MSSGIVDEVRLPDPATFRMAMRRLPTAVTVFAATVEDRPVGMVIGTFTSVSLDPLLVGFLGDDRSRTLATLLECRDWSFSVLGQQGAGVTDAFRGPQEERFSRIGWHRSANGAPVLDDAIVTIDATRHATLPAGDHHFVLAEVRDVRVRNQDRPLIFFDGRMLRLDPLHLLDGDYERVSWQDLS